MRRQLDSVLTMRARVERGVEQGENAFGQPTTAPETVYGDLECFIWPESGRHFTTMDGEKIVSIGDYSMTVRPNVQLRELDRLLDVLDPDGEPIPEMARLRVLQVIPFPGLRPPEVALIQIGLERIV